MATQSRIVDFDGEKFYDMMMEIETQRDESRKKAGEKRITMSVFLTIYQNIETEEFALMRIKAFVFDPKRYVSPKWPKTVYEFEGDSMLEDVRKLIATENQCSKLYNKLPELIEINCDDEIGHVFGDVSKDIAQDAYGWFKSRL
jgi:hypothetical protein